MHYQPKQEVNEQIPSASPALKQRLGCLQVDIVLAVIPQNLQLQPWSKSPQSNSSKYPSTRPEMQMSTTTGAVNCFLHDLSACVI